ncbi:MAG: GGDEF domain-containing protein [Chloroflexota bacterium]|nr:GGDEF domain-containing protein [Chloroflexota bacterium]MDE3192076.1 GGDEF domain-containing protein [Chloroflexota bacterium]
MRGAASVAIGQYDQLVVLAVIVALLVNVFFLFRIVPWSRPGSWRRIWILAAIASFMFILSEAAILGDLHLEALDTAHQVPLFGALLAGAAGFFLVYTDAYRAAERSRVLALTDMLTSLPNRRAFEERLKVAFEKGERFALLYVDLDGFKQVNDRCGHAAGDIALARVGGVLRQCVRQADMAARVGGDEFCLLLLGADHATTRFVADRVLRGVREIELPQAMRIGASFGIASEADGRDPEEVVAAADAAMYRAKRQEGEHIATARPFERPEARPA